MFVGFGEGGTIKVDLKVGGGGCELLRIEVACCCKYVVMNHQLQTLN